MKIFILLLIIFIGISKVEAQKELKYKDVFQTVSKNKNKESFALLMQYQRQDPTFANAYYQMGLISYLLMLETDPMIFPADQEYFGRHAKIYFGLATKFMNEKESKMYREYYPEIKGTSEDGKIQNADIINEIQMKLKAVEEHSININKTVHLYAKSIDFYQKSIGIFKSINESESRIKDLYLRADTSILKRMQTLKTSFDSTIYYLNGLIGQLKSYPVKSYKPSYKLQEISTYRLEGLTNTNILNEQFELWNFGAWVDQFTGIINSDVEPIKKAILDQFELNTKVITEMIQKTDQTEPFNEFKIDAKLMNKINKYDFSSIMNQLFIYQQAKINTYCFAQSINSISKKTYKNSFSKQVKAYFQLYQKKLLSDSLIKNFENNIQKEKCEKYPEVFVNKLGGYDNLPQYINQQKKEDQLQSDKTYDKLKKSLILELKSNVLANYYYKNIKIQAKIEIQDINSLPINTYQLNDIDVDASKSNYITGYFVNAQKKVEAFVAKSDSVGKILWLKNFLPDANYQNMGSSLCFLPNGTCVFVMHSKASTGQADLNFLIQLDNTGNETFRVPIKSEYLCRYIHYDEINDQILLACKGKYAKDAALDKSDLIIQNLDSKGNILWQSEIKIHGNLVEIVKMNEEFFIFCNVLRYWDQSGQEIIIDHENVGSANGVCFVQSLEGKFQQSYLIESKNPNTLYKIVKINSNTLSLFGLYDKHEETVNIVEDKRLFYCILTNKGKVQFMY